ncbi:MAG: extracellular solute-binding protein, partial [Bifidobacteriaceae bacterium]|nr:extracellular solute-binding protein [Bifidobacteriaceae bacterium]
MGKVLSPRRRIAAGLSIVALAMGLAACSQGSQSPTAPSDGGVDEPTETADGGEDAAQTPQDDGEGTVTMVTLNEDRSDFDEPFRLAGAELEKIVGAGIDPRNVPSTENYQQIVRQALQTDATTDIVKWWNGYRLQELARTGGLADISAAWDEAAANGWVNPDTRDSFSYDGKVYAMPLYKTYWMIFYNKDVFTEVGIEPPTTWAQFEENNDKLKAAGVTPLFATQEGGWTSFIWFAEILSKLDPDFYVSLMDGDSKYTDPTAVEAMEIWADMYEKGWFTAADVAWDNEPSLFAAGEVAQVPMGTWRNGTFQDAGLTTDQYGAYLLPAVNDGGKASVIVESGVIAVAERAPQKDAAMDVMANWLNPQVQQPWIDQIKDTSANPDVTSGDPVLASVVEQVAAAQP